MVTTIYLVQHGDKERIPGDPGLTEVGKGQAAVTARWLQGTGLRALYSSPLRRARETAEPIGQATLARQLGQQAQHERPGPAPRLRPAEPGTGPGHQLIECPQPAARVYAGAGVARRSSRAVTNPDDQTAAAPSPVPAPKIYGPGGRQGCITSSRGLRSIRLPSPTQEHTCDEASSGGY